MMPGKFLANVQRDGLCFTNSSPACSPTSLSVAVASMFAAVISPDGGEPDSQLQAYGAMFRATMSIEPIKNGEPYSQWSMSLPILLSVISLGPGSTEGCSALRWPMMASTEARRFIWPRIEAATGRTWPEIQTLNLCE